MPEFRYDAAISFLNQDLGVADETRALVEPGSSVWIYSENQRQLAGTNGVPSFSDVFGRDARLVVILYRSGWGESGWTAIEREAMDSRRLRDGSDFLLFVRVDDSELPSWIPATRIWTRLDSLGVTGLAAVVEERIVALGAKKVPESAEDIAIRLQLRQRREAERDLRLQHQGPSLVRAELEKARQALRDAAERCGFAYSEDDVASLIFRGGFSTSVAMLPYSVDQPHVFYGYLKTWRGRPNIGGRFFGEAEEMSCETYVLDILPPEVVAWRHDEDETRALTTESFVERATLALMQMVEQEQDRRRRERPR